MNGQFRIAKAKHLQRQSLTRKRDTAHRFIVQINLVRPLASLVFGKHHSSGHRILAGLAVAAVGVIVVKTFHVSNEYAAIAVDGIGYGLHGLGLTPVAEYLSSVYSSE